MKKNKLNKIIAGALSMGLIFTLTACGNSESSEGGSIIKISGSTSVGPIMEKLSEEYSKDKEINIEINQVGSSAGIKDVIDGLANIGMSSRGLKEDEEGLLDETVIAYDGIAVVVNPSTDVVDLTTEDIKDIFTGEITKWSELGIDKEGDIVVLSREDGSGTRDAFQEIIGYGSEELVDSAMVVNSNGALKEAIYGNENSIGFISFEYLDEKVKAVKVNGVEANADNVKSNLYELSRPFLVVNQKNSIEENSKAFVDFILSEEGQAIVSENGLISTK